MRLHPCTGVTHPPTARSIDKTTRGYGHLACARTTATRTQTPMLRRPSPSSSRVSFAFAAPPTLTLLRARLARLCPVGQRHRRAHFHPGIADGGGQEAPQQQRDGDDQVAVHRERGGLVLQVPCQPGQRLRLVRPPLQAVVPTHRAHAHTRTRTHIQRVGVTRAGVRVHAM